MRIRLTALCLALLLVLLPAKAFARDELKNTDPDKYYILLDCNNEVITVYEKDDDGKYTRIVRRMICTSGRTELDPDDPEDVGTPTPNGTWKIGSRERFGKFASFANEYARYWTQIVDGVYFHSIMFGARNIDKLKSSAFSHLGNRGSHGCVRLYVEDAKWLYYNACPGTTVKVSYSEAYDYQLTDDARTDMSFKEYDAFQKGIFDYEELPDYNAWVTVEKATLRTGNGSNDSIIKNLAVGDELRVLQDGTPWIKVAFDGREGYVKRAYVTYEQGVVQSVPDGHVLKSTQYLYAEPDSGSTRICKVPHDTVLEVLEPDNKGYTKVRYYTAEGYVQSKYITEDWACVY